MTAWLVTGGAGFIGSNFVRMAADSDVETIVVLDALTYAGNVARGGLMHAWARSISAKAGIPARRPESSPPRPAQRALALDADNTVASVVQL